VSEPAEPRRLPVPRNDPAVQEWLTLEQASRRLGVHAATLRRWTDQRSISVFLTPGGHRRFRRSEIERFEREHQREHLPESTAQPWAELAVAHTRLSVTQQTWLATHDQSEREAERSLGRRLISLMLNYAARTDLGADVIAEARSIGEEYARIGLHHSQPVSDLLRAVSFFRGILLDAALSQRFETTKATVETSLNLLRRIERLIDEVQVGVVEAYVSGSGA
jgi:excisionase family DNA binding protein